MIIGLLLAYSDYLASLRNSLDTMKQYYRKSISVAAKIGLNVNDIITEYIIIGQRKCQQKEYRSGVP